MDTDRWGRLLRYVQTVVGRGQIGDYGLYMVRYDHTGVYQGDNDASDEYVQQLYAADLVYAENPPSGRECGEPDPPPPADNSGGVYVDTDDGGDDGMRDGALTGGYCARKWWC